MTHLTASVFESICCDYLIGLRREKRPLDTADIAKWILAGSEAADAFWRLLSATATVNFCQHVIEIFVHVDVDPEQLTDPKRILVLDLPEWNSLSPFGRHIVCRATAVARMLALSCSFWAEGDLHEAILGNKKLQRVSAFGDCKYLREQVLPVRSIPLINVSPEALCLLKDTHLPGLWLTQATEDTLNSLPVRADKLYCYYKSTGQPIHNACLDCVTEVDVTCFDDEWPTLLRRFPSLRSLTLARVFRQTSILDTLPFIEQTIAQLDVASIRCVVKYFAGSHAELRNFAEKDVRWEVKQGAVESVLVARRSLSNGELILTVTQDPEI